MRTVIWNDQNKRDRVRTAHGMNKMRERQGDRVRTVTWDGQNER